MYGSGFGSTDASMSVTLDGVEIFNGVVPTIDQLTPDLPTLEPVVICSFELPMLLRETRPMTCEVTNGTVVFAQFTANYCRVPNPVLTPADWAVLDNPTSTHQERYDVYASHATPPFSAEDTAILMSSDTPFNDPAKIQVLKDHGVFPYSSTGVDGFGPLYDGDARSNVTIDGTTATGGYNREGDPTTWWTVNNSSVLAYDLNLKPGINE